MKYFLGVDVGTSSVRVGIFNENGEYLDHKTESINVYNFKPNFYEQSSNEIIEKIILCINFIVKKYNASSSIQSIGFDATCSLVVLDEKFESLCISPSGRNDVDIIMWMDHRAIKQADFINSTNYDGLKFVGGTISPEMDPPKILWLKQNMKETFNKAKHFFSLPDFLVWKFTNKDVRSVCSATCKWLFRSDYDVKKWDPEFWKKVGLDELINNNFDIIGSRVEKPLTFCDDLIISKDIASKASLNNNVKIGVSMIDAHAGGIGGICLTYGYLKAKNVMEVSASDILVLVSGTSSCFMASSVEPKFIEGVWGPYNEAMIPNMWLNEGGQSASGKLLDHLITTHPAYEQLMTRVNEASLDSYYDLLNNYIIDLAKSKSFDNISYLAKDVHVYPDFHGNRSPLSDPSMKGQITGLSFDVSLENLACMYIAAVQAIVYQTRHIIECMNSKGMKFKVISIIGGLIQNSTYCQMVCDVCNIPVLVQNKINTSVIFGSAILGASNCSDLQNSSFDHIMQAFSRSNSNALDCTMLNPNTSIKKFHDKKYAVYKQMIEDQLRYNNMMKDI